MKIVYVLFCCTESTADYITGPMNHLVMYSKISMYLYFSICTLSYSIFVAN